MAAELVKVTVDGITVEVPKGTNVIETAKRAGVVVPHYCYHPKLSIAGNCRMCLVEIGMPKLSPERKPEVGPDGKPVIAFLPKLQPGCNTTTTDGMVVLTKSPKVVKARTGVMEFLLINHPLDCPICDQAGECRLQEFAADHSRGITRFVEEKVHKPKQVALGSKITLDVERCIMCERCIRFMREIAHQDVLGFTQRGSHTELTCVAGEFPDTNYDLNIVDLCPVGALTSTDFRFQQRVWFLKETRSLCPHCATGCNTLLWSREGVLYRQTPRDNEAVNSCWMCDTGRLDYRFVNAPDRLVEATWRDLAQGGTAVPADWTTITDQAAARLRQTAPGSLAVIGSARATTEELYLLAKLAKALGADQLDCVPRSGPADHFLVSADRNPNSQGAWLTGTAAHPLGSRLPEIARGIQSGSIRGLIVLNEDVSSHGISLELLGRLDWLLVLGTHPSATTQRADFLLPGATFAEKRGTFINGQGRIQRLNAAFPPPGQARPEWQSLQALLQAVSPDWAWRDLDGLFAAMAAELSPLAGLSLAGIGDQGLALNLPPGA